MKEKRLQLSFMLTKQSKNEFLDFCKGKMLDKSLVIESLINEFVKREKLKK